MRRLVLVLAVSAAAMGCEPGERSFEQPLTLGGQEVAPSVLNLGEIVYMRRCRGCHGQHGGGDGQYGSTMTPRPADLTLGEYPRIGATGGALPSDDDLRRIITEGIEGTGMPAQPLDGEALEAVLQYIKTLAPVWRQEPTSQRVQ